MKKLGNLGTGRNERRARRRRALIGVRRPEVERHRRHLEAEADHRHHHRHHQQRVRARCLQCGRDLPEVGRAGQPVKQAQAEQRERRRHAAEQEILQRRLGRLGRCAC